LPALLSLLREQNIEAIDKVLAPFFRDAPTALWPRLVMIEDARQQWAVDLFALMAKKNYRVAARTKFNVVLRI
jgi:hypothetical protein